MSKIWQLQTDKLAGEASMAEAFPFLCAKSGIVSYVGAGGKTTLMYQCAQMVNELGKKAVITTTTRIQNPGVPFYVGDYREINHRLCKHHVVVTGHKESDNKLSALPPQELGFVKNMAEFLFIEADGAKGMPCKVPKMGEPVIDRDTEIVVGVLGLDAIGMPLQKVCFRIEEATALLRSTSHHILTQDDVVKILLSPEGLKKDVNNREYYIVLNKCDDPLRMNLGMNIINKVVNKGGVNRKNCCLTCLQ